MLQQFRTSERRFTMTDMRRVTISLPDEIDRGVLELRKDDRFIRSSYSEIVRLALERGLDLVKNEAHQSTAQPSAPPATVQPRT